jgi:hypothetical protein
MAVSGTIEFSSLVTSWDGLQAVSKELIFDVLVEIMSVVLQLFSGLYRITISCMCTRPFGKL